MIIAKINKNTVKVDSGSKWEIKYSKDFSEYMLKAKEILLDTAQEAQDFDAVWETFM